jgi:Na+-driven multidrug efflux pump
MVVLPALGLARGVETVVGQNLGANQRDRAVAGVRAAVGLVVAAFALLSVLVYVFAGPVIDLFVTGTGSAAVIAAGEAYLRTVGVTYLFLGVFYVMQGGFRGSGRT